MKTFLRPAATGAILFAGWAIAGAQFTGGNLVVSRVGDGSAPLTSAANPVFLDQYTAGGTLVSSTPMPTTASGTNLPLVASGSATSELSLNISGDNRYFIVTGYDAAPGTAGIASSTVPRVMGRIAMDGTIDTSTTAGTFFSGNNIRSAWTPDGQNFWAVGANSGVIYAGFGGVNTAAVCTTSANNRVIKGQGSDIWYMSGAGTRGLYDLPGNPLTGPNTSTNMMPTGQTSSPYDFIVVDANDIYVADDSLGLQKWVNNGGVWSVAYSATPASGVFVRSLAYDGTNIYAIATNDTVVQTQDSGIGFATFTTVATAATNTHIRGIKLVPAASQQQIGPASYTLSSGQLVSGDVTSLQTIDENYLVARPGLSSGIGDGIHRSLFGAVQVDVTATTSPASASALQFTLVAHASTANVNQTIELFDFNANQYVAVDSRRVSTGDQTVTITASNPARFVKSTGQILARVMFNQTGPVASLNWTASVDQTLWTITH